MRKETDKQRRFMVIEGGLGSQVEGPATRLNLYDRLPAVENKKLAVIVLTKVVLLGAMLYFIHGIAR